MKTHAVTIVAIIAIAGLAALALMRGMDTVALTATIGVIAALGGYQVGKRRGKPLPPNDTNPPSDYGTEG